MKRALVLILAVLTLIPLLAGSKNTATKSGKKTVRSDARTIGAKKKEQQARAAFQKDIDAAPRRTSGEPIRVTLLAPVWEGRNRNDSHERANEMLLSEFRNDPVLRMTLVSIPRRTGRDNGENATLAAEAVRRGKSADVFISTVLGTEAALDLKGNSRLAVGNTIVYKATLFSPFVPDSKEAKTHGNLHRTSRMVKALAAEIRDLLVNDLGPRLPSPAALEEINKKHLGGGPRGETGLEPGDHVETGFKNLPKPKTKPQ